MPRRRLSSRACAGSDRGSMVPLKNIEYWGLYWDHEKENGKYYLGSRV